MRSVFFVLLAIGTAAAVVACYRSAGLPNNDNGTASKSGAYANSDIGTLTAQNFDQGVLKSSQPVLVDFFATWCGPCKKMAPIVKDFAYKHKLQWRVFECDIDQNRGLANQFGIDAVPTFLVFKGGKLVGRFTGYDAAETFESNIMGSL